MNHVDLRLRSPAPRHPDADRPAADLRAVRTLPSDTLFRGDREVRIEHHGALYRLKITRQGKLILNK